MNESTIPFSIIKIYKDIGNIDFVDDIDRYTNKFLVDVVDVHMIIQKNIKEYLKGGKPK